MQSQLAKGLYKTALRRAIQFDKEPVLKCLLTQESFDHYYSQIKNGSMREKELCKDRLDSFLCHNQYYSMDQSLVSFLRQQVRQSADGESDSMHISVLLRLSDYLHSCVLFANNHGYIGKAMDSSLPAPRDVRECYDRIHPTLETEKRSEYAGYVLLQNPSMFLQAKNWGEEDDRVKSLLCSCVMYLLSPVQNQYQMLFLSDSQQTSRSELDMKKRLVQLAQKLHGGSATAARPSLPKEGRRRAHVTLDSETQQQLDSISVAPSDRMEDYLALQKEEELDCYNWKHVMLGGAFANPVVLFDRTQLDGAALSQLEYSDELHQIGSSTEYERLLRLLSETGKETVPLCLDCTTVFAPVSEIAEAVREKQLFAVAVEDVRDLLFNCTIDRRFIYPNLLKRMGGEFARCADVIYSILASFDSSV